MTESVDDISSIIESNPQYQHNVEIIQISRGFDESSSTEILENTKLCTMAQLNWKFRRKDKKVTAGHSGYTQPQISNHFTKGTQSPDIEFESALLTTTRKGCGAGCVHIKSYAHLT